MSANYLFTDSHDDGTYAKYSYDPLGSVNDDREEALRDYMAKVGVEPQKVRLSYNFKILIGPIPADKLPLV